mmetsp:Transcript_58171/g.138467  ORF Transcript_58171/g.138467 Transcript_58171/m.138467 type:complete len:257 (+) Transcript_58171:62-832(+)|eukprot:CAMPEP_0180118072 /NCGR_PEP_ID=MMETSP0986-20121125/1263_1 /TAXON_ID=697907 /ORGANISM="non described non described, Strain CCMP2293" /LENGTH=256 /DNA_ID=CAMNT_0022057001 /DNA_START=55 /DNA_END=825 /DNA_ORIENTATION=+
MAQELDVIELENMVRTPFRSGGVKVVGEDGKPVYMEGPERIPKTHGRKEVYLNTKGIGDIGAKLVGNELKKNTDCLSLWLSGNGITALGAAELAKGLKQNKTLTLLDLHDNKLGNEGAKALAQVLKTNTTLKILNICSSGIGPKLPMALEKHPTLQCLCFEVVTASPLVPHDPWTTSHTQMATKKSKVKDMLFEWNKGSMYGITGLSRLNAPWERSSAPTMFPGLKKIEKGLSGVSRGDPEFDPTWKSRTDDDLKF